MAQSFSAALSSREAQAFPVLPSTDIARMQRFGEAASYEKGERIMTAGTAAPGLVVVHSRKIAVSQNGKLGDGGVIVTHGAGQFMGELAQLSARPALVDADAIEP